MGIFYREKKSPDKVSNDIQIQKFLKEAFSLYAWCIHEGPNSVDETFEEYFANEDGRDKLRERMQNFNTVVLSREDTAVPLVETIQWCIHEGDRIIWNKMEENDGIWTFNVTYRHKHMEAGLLDRKPVIGTEFDFEEIWTVRNNGEDRVVVIKIDDGKNIQNWGGMESGDFEMPGKKMGRIIKDKKWCKNKLPHPF